jgi:hypothetical protein
MKKKAVVEIKKAGQIYTFWMNYCGRPSARRYPSAKITAFHNSIASCASVVCCVKVHPTIYDKPYDKPVKFSGKG